MIIDNLKLKNFGIIKNADINFNEGINLIIGENGQGKSNILKAIAFMLINYKKSGTTIEDYCNWDSKEFNIYMTLKHLSKDFIFDYQYLKGSNKLTRNVTIDNDLFVGQDSIKELENYFDPSLCKASILSFQGEMSLVDTQPSVRRDNLKKIYDLDFSKQVKEIKFEIEELQNNQIKELENKIIVLKNKEYKLNDILELPFSEDVYKDKSIEIKDIENNIILINQKIEEYDNNMKSINEIKESIKKDENSYDIYNDKIKLLNDKITSLEKDLEKDVSVEKRKLEEELNQDFEIELRKLEEENEAIILQRISSYDTSILDGLNHKLNIEKAEIINIKHKIELIKKGSCPECGSVFDCKDLEKYEIKLKEFIKITEELEAQIKLEKIAEQKILDNIKEQDKLVERKKYLVSQIEAEKKNIESKKTNIISAIEREEKIIAGYKDNINNMIKENNNQINILQENINNLNTNIISNREKLNTLLEKLPAEKPEKDSGIENKLNILKNEIDSYNRIVETNKVYEKQNEEINKQKEVDKIELDKLIVERDSFTKQVELLEYGKTIMQKEFPNYVINSMVSEIEEGINEIVKKVYNSRYNVEVVKQRDGIGVVYGSQRKDIAISSGFEQQLFNLGYKNAFAQISNLGIIFLDEIDSYASEENSKKLFEVIGEMSELYKQLFIVTHKIEVQEILMNNYNTKTFYISNGEINEF